MATMNLTKTPTLHNPRRPIPVTTMPFHQKNTTMPIITNPIHHILKEIMHWKGILPKMNHTMKRMITSLYCNPTIHTDQTLTLNQNITMIRQ